MTSLVLEERELIARRSPGSSSSAAQHFNLAHASKSMPGGEGMDELAELAARLADLAGMPSLDARAATSFNASHVRGSTHVPAHELGSRVHELPPSINPLAVVCDQASEQDCRAFFEDRNFKEVSYLAWEDVESLLGKGTAPTDDANANANANARARVWQEGDEAECCTPLWRPSSLVEAFVAEYMVQTDAHRHALPGPVVAQGSTSTNTSTSGSDSTNSSDGTVGIDGTGATAADGNINANGSSHSEPLPAPPAPHTKRGLDLGCGSGRDMIYLAQHGWHMTGIDSNGEHPGSSLDRCNNLAARHNLAANVATLMMDMEGSGHDAVPNPALLGTFGPGSFDLVCVVRYLHRPLMPIIDTLLRPGGVIVYQTFMEGATKPRRAKFKLKPQELAETFPSQGYRHLLNKVETLSDGRPVSAFIAQKL